MLLIPTSIGFWGKGEKGMGEYKDDRQEKYSTNTNRKLQSTTPSYTHCQSSVYCKGQPCRLMTQLPVFKTSKI